ncbi:MAG TPA: RNA polymerase subunit sigma-70 [Verrucomicrobiales bacterium]|nr:RNA polymerase subunit sigma-70 [Verrucomicrobiales bacterium]
MPVSLGEMANIESHLLSHLGEFLGFARARLRDPDLAADAVQESLLKALQRGGQLRDDERARAWFYRILRNTIIDLQRRSQIRDRAADQLAVEFSVAADQEADRAVCRCLNHLLPSLKPDYADLIRRIDLQGELPEDLSVELSVSRSALTVRLHRARRQLKERLEATCRVCAKHGCLDCHCEPETRPETNRA